MPSVGVIIPAGGKGVRFGGRVPKQFHLLEGSPILRTTVTIFHSLKEVGEVVVVVPPANVVSVSREMARAGLTKVTAVVPGGRERQDSVRNGLMSFKNRPDIVLVHDAVRPLVSPASIRQVIRSAQKGGAAVVGVRLKDTIKTEYPRGFYQRTLDRSNLWAVQTPQGFRYDVLLKAHQKANRDRFTGTDESSLVERLGIAVRIVEGDERNFKITTRRDLELAKILMKRRK
ncbi:MAG: ispD [Bacteroidetes bacterium]|nr:ispD [Bacteroidota bacterium]